MDEESHSAIQNTFSASSCPVPPDTLAGVGPSASDAIIWASLGFKGMPMKPSDEISKYGLGAS